MTKIRGIHLVGSIPLADETAVFETVSGMIGDHLRRLPDGETGERSNWIGWQFPIMAAAEQLEQRHVEPKVDYLRPIVLALKPGEKPAEVVFKDIGYSRVALASYQTFKRLKQEGVLPTHIRFQVTLPTPLAPITFFVKFEDRAVVEQSYEARMLAELNEIMATIPHQELAIQWDTAVEFAHLDAGWATHFSDPYQGILDRLLRLGQAVEPEVELGYHLCYGDANHHHFVEPADCGLLVQVANDLAAGLKRPLNWIHMPVPRERTDEAYYTPLKKLKRRPETELYLGVVHHTDGVIGTKARIKAAQAAITDFGIATECGLGRRPLETISDLLRIHQEAVNL